MTILREPRNIVMMSFSGSGWPFHNAPRNIRVRPIARFHGHRHATNSCCPRQVEYEGSTGRNACRLVVLHLLRQEKKVEHLNEQRSD